MEGGFRGCTSKLQIPAVSPQGKFKRFPTVSQAQNPIATVSREVRLLSPKCVARNEMESGYKKGVSKFKPTLFNRKGS